RNAAPRRVSSRLPDLGWLAAVIVDSKQHHALGIGDDDSKMQTTKWPLNLVIIDNANRLSVIEGKHRIALAVLHGNASKSGSGRCARKLRRPMTLGETIRAGTQVMINGGLRDRIKLDGPLLKQDNAIAKALHGCHIVAHKQDRTAFPCDLSHSTQA